MPGDTCATCRLDLEAEDNSRLDNAERDHQPLVKSLYLGNWPGKEVEEQGR